MNPKEQGKERKELDFGKIEYLISDWDGTLTDSMPAYTESFSKTLERVFGIQKEVSRQYYLDSAGDSLSSQLRETARRFAQVKIEDTTQLEQQFWQNLTGFKPHVLPKAKEFLAQVKIRGIKIIIWSGTRPDVLEEKIKLLTFSSLVDYAVGSEPGSSNLVKGPGLFAKIAEHFGVSEDELRQKSVVLGDGSGDIKVGLALGVPTIGIVGTQSKGVLENAGANLIVDNLEALAKFFK